MPAERWRTPERGVRIVTYLPGGGLSPVRPGRAFGLLDLADDPRCDWSLVTVRGLLRLAPFHQLCLRQSNATWPRPNQGQLQPSLALVRGAVSEKYPLCVLSFLCALVKQRRGNAILNGRPMEALGGYGTDSGSDADTGPAVPALALPSASALFTEAPSGPQK